MRPTTSSGTPRAASRIACGDAEPREAAVRHDAEPAQAEQVGAARRPRGRSRRGARAAPGAAAGRPPSPRATTRRRAGCCAASPAETPSIELQRDVAGEAVGDDHVGAPVGVVALDVPDEAQVAVGERSRSARAPRRERRALRRPPRRSRAGRSRARRRRARVASAAPMNANCTRCSGRTSTFAPTSTSGHRRAGDGHRDRERGTVDAARAADVEEAGGERGTGRAAGDERVGVALGDGARRGHDRGVRRRADAPRGSAAFAIETGASITSTPPAPVADLVGGPVQEDPHTLLPPQRAPSATSAGPRSAPLASTATVISSARQRARATRRARSAASGRGRGRGRARATTSRPA